MTLDPDRRPRFAGHRKVVAMIVDRAKPGNQHGPSGKLCRQRGIVEKSRQIKTLPLDIKVARGVHVGNRQMPAIRGKHRRLGTRIHRAGLRLELAVEEFIEAAKAIRRIGKSIHIEPIILDEGADLRPARRPIHPPPIPMGKPGTLDRELYRQPAQRIAVGPAQESFTVNRFGFDLSTFAVEILYRSDHYLLFMKRSALLATNFFAVFLLSQVNAESPAEKTDDAEAAKAVGLAYQDIFAGDDAFSEQLGNATYQAIFHEMEDESTVVTEAQRAITLEHVSRKLDKLSEIADAPEADFGRQQEFREKGPGALIPSVGPIRNLAFEASWYAKETWAEDPDKAIQHLRDAQAAARHVGQDTPSLITNLTQIAIESIVLNTFAELAPQMNRAQMRTVLTGIESLPAAGTLEEAIRTEQDFFAGWFRRKIDEAMKTWENEIYGSTGFRFPQDLRLAGVALLPNRPVRISLHNTRNGQTFWLEEGKEVHGIRIESVEYKPPRAWIAQNGMRALVDLQKETIEHRYVPWEVLISVFASFDGQDSEPLTDAEKEATKQQLTEFGLTPETAFDSFDRIDAFYDEAIQHLGLPASEFEAWENEFMETGREDPLVRLLAPALSAILEHNNALHRKYEALEQGFAIQAQSEGAAVEDSDFKVTQNENGFTVTPNEFVGSDREYRFSLHFGTAPPEPDE